MDLARFMQTVPDEFYAWGSMCAHPRGADRYIEVFDTVQGMSTPATMHILNYAVQLLEPGEAYLEVGTWRGLTMIGALLGNEARGCAIDNGSMVEHNAGDGRINREVWQQNIDRYGLTERATYIDGEVPSIWERFEAPPIGVYFFDGDKSTSEAAYAGLMGVTPFLAKHALILCDDANVPQIREAAFWFCHEHREKAFKILDLPTPANCWPSFWNGLLMIAWGVGLAIEVPKDGR